MDHGYPISSSQSSIVNHRQPCSLIVSCWFRFRTLCDINFKSYKSNDLAWVYHGSSNQFEVEPPPTSPWFCVYTEASKPAPAVSAAKAGYGGRDPLPMQWLMGKTTINYAFAWWFGTCLFFPHFGNHHPTWRSNIFQRGRLNHQPVIRWMWGFAKLDLLVRKTAVKIIWNLDKHELSGKKVIWSPKGPWFPSRMKSWKGTLPNFLHPCEQLTVLASTKTAVGFHCNLEGLKMC